MLGCYLKVSSTEENVVSVFWVLYDEDGESEGSDDGGNGRDDDGGGDSIVRVAEMVMVSVRIIVVMVTVVMGKVFA